AGRQPRAEAGDEHGQDAGRDHVEDQAFQSTTSLPAAANVAPMTPPISACDDEEGIPKNHVRTFHRMAPTKPAKTTSSVTTPWSTMPFAIVAATETEMNAPAKLRIAAT